MWHNNGNRYANASIMLLERYKVSSSWFLFRLPAVHWSDVYKSERPDLSFPFAVSEHRVDERLQYMPRQCHCPFWSWLRACRGSVSSWELGQKMQVG